MKKRIFSALIAGTLLSSCAVTTPFTITNNEVGTKIGKSETICLFAPTKALAPGNGHTQYNGIMLNKNFSIAEAAKKGGIEKIGLVDLKVTNYIFFVKKEFIVSGE